MKAAPFRYERPTTLDDALAVLHDATEASEEAKALAGGQSLIPLLALRLARPTVVVDLNHLAELAAITVAGDELSIGALVRHQHLCDHPLISRHAPLLARAAGHIGHRPIRARGTIGGSLAHADPAAELPLVCQVLDASVSVASAAGGTRRVPLSEVFTGPLQTVLGPTELIVAVHVPTAAARRDAGFAELARRPGDFALVLAAAAVTIDADGSCRQASVAVGGVGGRSGLIGSAGRALVGTRLDDASVAGAAAAVRAALAPNVRSNDTAGSARYQLEMATLMATNAINEARR